MYEKYQLSNGLSVILVPSSKSPVVTAQMWVKTGSADEQKAEEGLTHFIEHLLFKGTEKYDVGQIAQEVEGSGGHINAYTSFDQTVYYMTLSKQFVEKSLDMLSQMIGYPSFDPQEVDNEREVVIEEIKRGLDSPSQFASRNLFETAYKKHPYSRPVIGYEKVVKNTSTKKIRAFFEKRYHPKNMSLILAGDFEKKEIKSLIKTYFGEMPFAKFEARKRIKEEKQTKARISIKESKFADTVNYIAWPIPPIKNKDIPALDLLSMILGYGDSSLLSREIRNKGGVVNSVSCSTYTPKDPGVFIISANHEPEKLEEYFKDLLESLKKWVNEGVKKEDLQRAITNLEGHEFYAMETVEGLANKYGSYNILMDDPGYFEKYMKAVKALSARDIVKVYKKYLKPETMSIAITSPGDKKQANLLARKFLKEFTKLQSTISVSKTSDDRIKHKKIKKTSAKTQHKVKSESLLPGVELVSYPNFEAATISLQLAFEGGSYFETDKDLGVSNLMADTWLAGTHSRSEQELSDELENKAIYISGFSGRNSTGLRLSCLSQSYEEAIEYFFEVLLEPGFEELAIKREKEILLNYLSKEKDRPSQMAHQQFMKNIFKGHSYALDPVGDKENIHRISREDILAGHKKMLSERRMVISAVGAFDIEALKKDLKSRLSKLNRKNLNTYSKKKLPPLSESTSYFEKLDKEQTHIFIGFRGLSFTDSRVHALRVLESVMAGQGGRLFVELRDKASLAYSVSPMRMEGIDTGYFGAYIACSTGKEEKAIRMMFEEFEKLKQHGISELELARAKQNLIGSYDIQMQKNSSIASKLLFDSLYGLGLKEVESHTALVEAVDLKQVSEIAKEIFSQNYVISVVGKKSGSD